MTNDLIASIGRQLNIPKSDSNEWARQVVYSIAGQMALASLWDYDENGESVSIQHFKTESLRFLMHMRAFILKSGFCSLKTNRI